MQPDLNSDMVCLIMHAIHTIFLSELLRVEVVKASLDLTGKILILIKED